MRHQTSWMTRRTVVALTLTCALGGVGCSRRSEPQDAAAAAPAARPKKPHVVHGAAGIDTGEGTQPGWLPFPAAKVDSLPRAVVPKGVELNLKTLAGRYAWAFTYGGHSLELEENGTWVYGSGACLGSFESSGTAKIVDGRVIFEMTDGDMSRGTTCAGVPVFWGERVYLLGADDFTVLVNAINWGDEPRMVACQCAITPDLLVRAKGDSWNTPLPEAPGLPLLPEPHPSRILNTPLEGRITTARDRETAGVDLGTEHGVFVGMKLYESRKDGYRSELEVTAVAERSCVVRRRWSDETPAADRIGQKVTCDAKGARR